MISKTELLLEIGTEEIPAGYIPSALEFMKQEMGSILGKNYLMFGKIRTAGTPRRLTIHVADLDSRQPDRQQELLGPPKKVAFDQDGNPTKAAFGFAKKNGVSVEELGIKETERGEYVCINKVYKGKDAKDIIAGLLPNFIASIPFPKTMRWGSEKVRFARPIRWIVALIGSQVVPFSYGSITSDRHTYGHRFASPGAIALDFASFESYIQVLKEAYCLVDVRARRHKLTEDASKVASEINGNVLEDKELEELNTFLTEYPWAICGSFDQKYLALPDPVLITCMKEHQKYFAVVDDTGKLMANFIAINNTPSPRPNLVKRGHERVLGARLADADFFFKEDTKRKLEEFVPELAGMVFHKGVGSLLDKVMRVQSLAEYIASYLEYPGIDNLKRAAYLCKADLCTEMVGEFPTLQGIMGKEYALLSGEPYEVARAIEEHYMPVRSGGELPESMPGTILSIADKMDTICATFAIGLKPTGTQDPYALRRQALGIINILLAKEIHISLRGLVEEALSLLTTFIPEQPAELLKDIMDFFLQRFKNELISQGIDYDVIDAATFAQFDSPYECYQRIQALMSVRRQPEFEPISIAFKRVMNILKGFHGGEVDPALFEMEQETRLYQAFLQAKEQISPILATTSPNKCPTASQYQEALMVLLALKPHIDSFFDHVMVMVEDERQRINRLSLLWMISRLFLQIGNLSYIVTESKDK